MSFAKVSAGNGIFFMVVTGKKRMKTIKHIYPMQEREVLMPKFASRFSCVGPECPFSCCMYFTIAFEKKNYDLLENHLALSSEQKKNYKKLSKSKRRDSAYAQLIAQGDSQACGFFQDDLCALHRDFGEEALNNVCYLYPRLYRSFVHGCTEMTVSMSCPEALRLALLTEDAFDFVQQKVVLRQEVIESLPKHLIKFQNILFDVHVFCMQILRVRELDLWKRVAILSLFCSHLDEIVSNSSHHALEKAVQNLMEGTTYLIQSGEIDSLYDEVVSRDDYLTSCYVCFKTIQYSWQGRSHFVELMASIEKLFFDGSMEFSFDLLCKNYKQGLKNLQMTLEDIPYFFEHLLLSELLELSFPFVFSSSKLSIQFLYRYICFVYLFLRFMLAFYCVHEVKTKDDLILFVSKLMRFIQHKDLVFQKEMLNLDQLHWEEWGLLYAHLKDDL